MAQIIEREVPLRASTLHRSEDIAVRQRGRARRGERIAAPPARVAEAHGLTLDAVASAVEQLRASGVPGDAPLVARVAPSPFAEEADRSHIVSIMAVVPETPATTEESDQP